MSGETIGDDVAVSGVYVGRVRPYEVAGYVGVDGATAPHLVFNDRIGLDRTLPTLPFDEDDGDGDYDIVSDKGREVFFAPAHSEKGE